MSKRAGWAANLEGQLIGLDSAPLIYLLESHPVYRPGLEGFFDAVAAGRLQVVTATITLVEVLTRPLLSGDVSLVARYKSLLLDTHGLATLDLTVMTALESARLRAAYNLRTPDAVQLATAITEGASHFLTNDVRLRRVTELRVLVLDDLR